MKTQFANGLSVIILFSVLLFSSCQMSNREESAVNSLNPKEAMPVERIKNQANGTPKDMIFIKGGKFKMGSNHGMPDELPIHEVSLNSFWIDKHEVTVAEFEKFVKETGFVTESEKIGWSGVFIISEGWTKCEKASWKNPDCIDKKPNPNEPVSQVSWNDANAYAKWAGKRLPTEAEFEYAARGGLDQNEYAWGNDLRPNGKPVANWWQGTFPDKDLKEDGFNSRSPVMSFPPNGYGLYDAAGNVWEWTADWYAEDYYKYGKLENPSGATKGDEKVIRGGSWLCAENYCSNYRVAGRSKSPTDSALNNLGFRLVSDE
jgi:formylglycine-generating enzyme